MTAAKEITLEELNERLEQIRDLDPWDSLDGDEMDRLPDDQWRVLWDRHRAERHVYVVDELMTLDIFPKYRDGEEGFVPGNVQIILEPVSWLAEQHRERIQQTANEILDAFSSGWWDADWDQLFEFPKCGITATLAGHESLEDNED